MRRLLLTLALLAASLLPSLPAWADGGHVTMTANAGYDGFAKAGRLVPVTIFLQNDGAEVSGELRFESTNPMGHFKSVGKHSYQVVVPAGATKRLDLLIPGMALEMPKLQFVVDGKTVQEVQPAISMVGDYLLGVLGVDAGDLAGMGGMNVNGFPVRLLPIPTASFPADAEALESLDALLLDRLAVAELSEQQQLALKSWVEHGGMLILAGGPEARRLEGLAPWLPLTMQDSKTVNLPGIGRAPLAQVDLSAWSIMHSHGDEPLVAWRKQGGGKVFLLTFDPALEPFASWPELKGHMERLLASRSAGIGGGQFMGDPMQILADNLSQFPVAPLPWLSRVLAMLIGYALLVGPVHLMLLRRFRKAGWVALSLPVLAAGLGGGVWLASGAAASARPAGMTFAIMQGQPGGHSVKYQAVAGFFASPGSAFEVGFGDAHLEPVVSWAMQDPSRPGEQPAAELLLRDGRKAVFEKRENWGLRAVGAKTRLPVSGTVLTDLTILENRLSGSVTNNLPFKLEHVMVVMGSQGQMVGDLEPGQSAEVSIPIAFNEWEIGNPHALFDGISRLLQVNWGPNGPGPDQIIPMRRQNLGSAAIHGIFANQNAERPLAVVVGFASEVPLGPSVNGVQSGDEAMAVYVQPIDPAYGLGRRIPHGMIQATSVGGFAQQLWPGWDLPMGEERVVQFTIPPELLPHLTQVELRAGPMKGTLTGTNPVKIDLLRWSDNQWVTVEQPELGDMAVAPGPFVNQDGQLQVRMTKHSEMYVSMQIPSLSVTTREVR